MKMKAAVLRSTSAKRPYATSGPIQIEEVELAPPQDGEVLVKIAGGRALPFRFICDQRPSPAASAYGAWS